MLATLIGFLSDNAFQRPNEVGLAEGALAFDVVEHGTRDMLSEVLEVAGPHQAAWETSVGFTRGQRWWIPSQRPPSAAALRFAAPASDAL